MNVSGYRCVACAHKETAAFVGYLCPSCGNNLEITYDYAAAATQIGDSWRDRAVNMFDFAALLPVARRGVPFPLHIGATPLYPAPRLGEPAGLRALYLKDETVNPSASIKDRASAVALQRAIDIGASTVSVASTGNAGSSMACLAAALGIPAFVFVPVRAPAPKLAQLLSFGAQVFAVTGSYDDAYDLCLAASTEFGWFNRSTGYNPYTREGKKTCAYEIWQALDGRVPDRVVVATGDGNCLSGMWKGWCDLRALGLIERVPRIDCAQSEGSAAITNTVHRVRSSGPDAPDWSKVVVDEVRAATAADSIAVDRPRDGLAAVKAVIESGGEAVAVPDSALLAAIPELAAATGVFAEPAAAATWAVLKQMVADHSIDADEIIVCVISGSGLKDVASVDPGQPHAIDPSLEAVREMLSGLPS